MDSSIASLSNEEEIKPYKIHVSSKYLDLTKKKLELTRLPHELLLPKAREWEHGTPKSEIEPLIDFWLEQYSWRTQETHLNNTLPQFRTAIKPSHSQIPLRVHFLHIKSPHAHAVPLLLIPTFPLTNLSLVPLYAPLTDPQSPTSSQPFHLVVPSIPGLGFSDAFSAGSGGEGEIGNGLVDTAEVFNTLMRRLGYEFYIASTTGSGSDSPAGIDYHLARLVGERYPENCLGLHLIAPPVQKPRLGKEPWEWVKFGVAKFFHANVWGYDAEDWVALREGERVRKERRRSAPTNTEAQPLLSKSDGVGYGAVGMVGLREPNTLAYALCDSPVGLLSLVCSALRKASPKHSLSNTEIINFTQLAWLPGPEAGMRFWAGAVKETKRLEKPAKKSRAAITVFGADGEGYTCPAWSSSKHDVIFSQRGSGKAGLVMLERTDLVVSGIKGLAKEVAERDGRLMIKTLDEVVVGTAEHTILEVDEETSLVSEHGMQLDVETPDTVVAVEMS